MAGKRHKNNRIVVGMSGGVDSSVALILLKKQGFEPIGVSLKYAAWESRKNLLKENTCCSRESFEIAKKICRKYKAPYYILDCSSEFKKRVMGYFTALFKNKQTPNPCLICNRDLKFKKLFEFAEKRGIKYVATGHYARKKINPKTGWAELLRAKDKTKDQSYFLCLLSQGELNRLIFPLGDYTKNQVYQIAKKEGFDFFLKRAQSQDLCFVSAKSIPFYLEEEIGLDSGFIQDKENYVLGKHRGLYFYTLGQRKRIGLAGGPWWVVDFSRKNNALIVSHDPDDPALYQKTAVLSNAHFISGKPLTKPTKVKTKIRYSQNLASATLYSLKNRKGRKRNFPYLGSSASCLQKLVFDIPQKAVTPGQWAVFYKGETCLGGGMII